MVDLRVALPFNIWAVCQRFGLTFRFHHEGSVLINFPIRSILKFYPLCPDRLWGPPSLLYTVYRWYFPQGYNTGGA
jgi:hypothetical protein